MQPHTLVAPHTCPAPVHVPQLTIRLIPQLSRSVTEPQFFDRREHICALLSGVQHVFTGVAGDARHSCPPVQVAHGTTVPQLSLTLPHFPLHVVVVAARAQPHWLGVTAPHPWPDPVPHVAPVQVTVPLQPFEIVPQLLPEGQLVMAVHPHRFAVPPPPHVCGWVHEPQDTVPLQPLGAVPQVCPDGHACAALRGVQPHTLAVPLPPHVSGGVHDPQVYVPPQPLGTAPQFLPAHAVDIGVGVQPQTFAVPPPPHVVLVGQVEPQLIVPPQPLGTVPQFLFVHAAPIDRGVHPQTLAVPGAPPPHVWPLGQPPFNVPQVSVPVPQPLSIVPQFLPEGQAVSGVHVLAHVPLAQT